MCSIVGSTNIEKVRELAKLNEYRGQHSHSFFVIDRWSGLITYRHRGFGELVIDDHVSKYDDGDLYYVVHQQAPTTENKTSSNIHPAECGESELLWHNGIIKANEIKRLQEELQTTNSWDTFLILRHLLDYNTVNGIDGTFSCFWYHQAETFIFRNEISPLFIDDELNISSTKFEGSRSLPANTMFRLWFGPDQDNEYLQNVLEEVSTFTTKENPYYFGV